MLDLIFAFERGGHKHVAPVLKDDHTGVVLNDLLTEVCRDVLCDSAYDRYISAKNIAIKKDSGESTLYEPDITGMGEYLTEVLSYKFTTDIQNNFNIKVRPNTEALWKNRLEKKLNKK